MQARNWRVADLFELGDGAQVRAELDAYAALAAQARLPTYSWYVPMWRATLCCAPFKLGTLAPTSMGIGGWGTKEEVSRSER